MTTVKKLGWYGLPRQAIPGVMLGMESVDLLPHDTPSSALSGGADIAVAFSVDEPLDSRTPRLAVIPEKRLKELLGWLHTFSSETFPLSQYCRVLTLSDWQNLSLRREDGWDLHRRYRWANLVAGEMLGQAEATTQVSSAPLGWAYGCLSYALARAVLVYGTSHEGLPLQVAERLGRCEHDRGLQRKPLTVRALSGIWPFAEQEQVFGENPADAVHSVLSAVSPQVALSLREISGLASSSAERRVQGFDEAVQTALALRNSPNNQRQPTGPILAGAAFLVGSGTSHIGLIEPYARECPEAYVWFGLMAGIAGPKSWDPDWMRLVKGVDRLLSLSHDISDAPQADLSWLEYEWLSNLGGSPVQDYMGSPKQNARSLTVELVPGAACQFRLAAGSSNGQPKTADSPRETPRATSAAPKETLSVEKLARARNLVKELQSLLKGDDSSNSSQPTLFGSPPSQASTKGRIYSKKSGTKGA
jgi:hypothetical protein